MPFVGQDTCTPRSSSGFHRCTPVSNPGHVVADILLTPITAVRNTGICDPADTSDRYSHTALTDPKTEAGTALLLTTDTRGAKGVLGRLGS